MIPELGFIPDDGGRKAAGYPEDAGDCVTRALAILTGRDYKLLFRRLADSNAAFGEARRADKGVVKPAYEKIFAWYGLFRVRLPKGPRPTYAEAHARYGDCIVSTVAHVCALKGGALRDTFDGRWYWWPDPEDPEEGEWRERKAQSVWITLPDPMGRK